MSSSSVTTPGSGSGSTASTTITTNYAYDPTGIRVQQTIKQAGQPDEVHDYLIDTNNPTGYQQVLEEKVNELLKKTFTLAMDVIAQHDAGTPGTPATNEDGSPWTPSMGSPANPATPATPAQTLTLLYDTHGSTRAVLSLAAEVIQRYSYSAYGQSLGFQVATAATSLLYSGEWTNGQNQGNLQYLRDRWMMPGVGRFTQMDRLQRGVGQDVTGSNMLLYANGDPANGIDPTGLMKLTEILSVTTTISLIVASAYVMLNHKRISMAFTQHLAIGLFWTSQDRNEVLRLVREVTTDTVLKNHIKNGHFGAVYERALQNSLASQGGGTAVPSFNQRARAWTLAMVSTNLMFQGPLTDPEHTQKKIDLLLTFPSGSIAFPGGLTTGYDALSHFYSFGQFAMMMNSSASRISGYANEYFSQAVTWLRKHGAPLPNIGGVYDEADIVANEMGIMYVEDHVIRGE